MKKSILIIGKTPPPIGGVTIHVKRLIDNLEVEKIKFRFISLTTVNLLILPFILINQKLVHLHTSSIKVQDYISRFCEIFKIKCIITFHGDLNRFNKTDLDKIKKIINRIYIPIVLNEGSYNLASKINKETVLVSSFIPPVKSDKLSDKILDLIQSVKKKYNMIYATNAYGLTYDKDRNEIYGIIDLISYFNKKQGLALLISDPSGEYSNFINTNDIFLNENIFVINELHSFYELLKFADASIRNTSTDGDSISLKESLYLKKITFATDVVSRPPGTYVYKRGEYNFEHYNKENIEKAELSGLKKLIKIYTDILQ